MRRESVRLISLRPVSRWTRLAGVTSLALAGIMGASAHAAPPKPAITVTPNTGLADGQHVQVSGIHYQNNQAIVIVECGGGDRNARPIVSPVCSDYSVAAQADAQGSFPAQDFVVHTTITGTRYGKGTQPKPDSHTCAAKDDCYIYAYAKNKGQRNARQDLSFGQTP
jgi:hypothetical protein